MRSVDIITFQQDQYDELVSLVEDLQAQLQLVETVFDADDKLKAAGLKINQLTEQVRVIQSRLNGEMNKNAELVRTVKSKDRQIAALQKQNAKLELAVLP